MAEDTARKGKVARVALGGIWAELMIAALAVTAILFSDEIGAFFIEGITLATGRVLPTTFPFMVLSSLICSMIDPSLMPRLTSCFGRVFSVGANGFSAFIIGSLTGFPIGAKMTADLVKAERLGRSEAERLMAYSSMPSVPFVIGAVGAGEFGDALLGALMLISIYIATVLTAQAFREKGIKTKKSLENTRQKYNFVASVKDAAISSIYMIAFVTLFFILISAVKSAVKYEPICTPLVMLLEVSGAVDHISNMAYLPMAARVGMSAFALGFGGVSVLAQVSAVTADAGLGMKKYCLIKLAVGLLSALISMPLAALYLRLR